MSSERSNDEAADAAVDAANRGDAASQAALAQGLPAVAPDLIEETHNDAIDNAIPSYAYQQLPVVALGGSAGGIQALKAFFAALPPGTGTAYVVILHLSPEHESTLPTLLQSVTALPVKAVQDGERLQADHVYVIPPRKQLTITDGHLRLSPLESERGRRVVVDLFFRALADAHGPHATAVVLSGADGDGAIGIKRVKERGGLTVAQEPTEAEHDSMPRTSIGTGMVDWVLRVADMPARIVEYRANEARLRLPPEEGPQPARSASAPQDEEEAALREVLVFLRMRTGNDFTCYKRATIVRRIGRRMQINGVTTLPAYLLVLRTHAGEAGALLQDLLISVTNFFRDRESFAAVKAQIPVLFAGKGPEDTVRVWCAACATGEEPYSMAMLLHEHARTLPYPPTIQVFGCDLDAQAIQTARAGIYPPSIVADVSEERIERFFVKEPRGYQVRRELRETVLFVEHDLLKDAPFSRLDLISCRNLLIYLEREAQARAMEIFHFALKPEGLLFLGSAESVDEERGLFAPLDKKHRLYVRRPVAHVGVPVSMGAGTMLRALQQAQSKEAPVLPNPVFNRVAASPFAAALALSPSEERATLADLHFRLTERYAPPSILVNAEGDVVHLSENAGRFLRSSGGHPTTSLLRTIHPALRLDLHAALLRLAETNAPVEIFSLPIELDGGAKRVDLRVAPAADLAPGYVLVSFDARARGAESGAATDAPVAATRPEAEELVRHLERELEQARTRLRDMAERAGATEEEYKSSNEELQSMNEELRSSSEELETSREELQSINEELTTVNLQLKHNVEELDRANSDLHSLMNATSIATVFLDRELKVIRYTSEAVSIFYLIPSDRGRPLTDLKQRIDYPGLEEDARQVLRTLTPLEREVGGGAGNWFMVRLAPYRSLEERIEGVVLTFVDIYARKQAEGAVRKSEEKYRALFASIEQGFVLVEAILDAAGKVTDYRYLETNPAVEGMHGLANLTGTLFSELAPDFESHWTEPADHVLRTGERACMENYHRALGRWYRVHYSAVGDPANRILGLLFEDITERKRRESDLAFLAEISQDLAHLTNIDETMNALGAKMGAHLGLSACIFGELFGENEAQTAELTHGWNRADVPSVVGTYRMSDFMSLELVRMWRTSQAVVIHDVFADPRTDGELYAKFSVGSFLGIPLVRNGTWQFLLCVYHSEPHDWSEEEVALVRELASRIWTRLEQARAEEALRTSEARLAVELEDTRQLQRISSSLIKEGNTEALYAQILEAACTVMRADMASVQMLVPERNELLLLAHKGFVPAAAKFWEWVRPNSGTSCAQVTSSSPRIIVPDVELDPKAADTEDLAHYRLAGIRAVQSTRLVSRNGRPIGMLSTHWREVHHPSERELRLFDVLARQVADLIERQIAGEALRASEQRLRTLADAVPQIIWTNSGDGVADYFNQRWHEYSGLTYEQSYGLGWQAIVHPDDAPRSVPEWEKALSAGVIFDTEYRLRGADGKYRWFIGRNVPLKDAAGQVLAWFGSATDIHALKAAEQEAEHARAAAETAGQAKDHFLAVLSHELRTPLMPINMALAVLSKRTDLPAAVTSTFAMIQRNVALESRFIDDLLDVTRIEHGKMEITRADIDLHEVIERAVEVSTSDIEAKKHQLTVTLEKCGCPFSGDFARLQQVFWNLLKNASKFTPHGGGIEIRSRCQVGDQFIVEVIDSGIGLEADAIERIFRPFEQASASITREFGGLGLGLAIAKATVEAHGGTLRVSSPGPSQGATFTVSLPLMASTAGTAETTA